MKLEMKVITQYIADDGTSFNTKEDCIKYEKRELCFSSLKDVFLFDDTGKEIKKTNFLTDMEQFLYIYVGSASSLKILHELNKEVEYILPEQEGFWKFEFDEYGAEILVNYEKYIDEVKQELKKYNRMNYFINIAHTTQNKVIYNFILIKYQTLKV